METLPIFLQSVPDLISEKEASLLWLITGEAFRTRNALTTLADLQTLAIPALEALGVAATLQPLPDTDEELCRLVQERLRYGVRVPLLQVLPQVEEATEAEISEEYDPRQAEQIIGGRVIASVPEGCAELRQCGQWALLLKRAKTKTRPSQRQEELLLRIAAFAAAYPNRLVTGNSYDAQRRQFLTEYFTAWGKKGSTSRHRRIRIVAQMFEYANPFAAFDVLTKLALEQLALPKPAHFALLDSERPLDPIERRELIYLARAGTLVPKLLALRRLKTEAEHIEVRNTLDQLQYDPHLWVRDAAR